MKKLINHLKSDKARDIALGIVIGAVAGVYNLNLAGVLMIVGTAILVANAVDKLN